MLKSVKSKAEQQFAASQKMAKETLQEKDSAGRERSEKTARLKALRMAKVASEAEA